MDYTEEIWEDLTYEEKQTYRLFEEFQKACQQRGNVMKWIPSASSKSHYVYDRDGKYPGDKIRESKNWKYFCEVYEMYKDDQNFDPHVFIDAVFRRIGNGKTISPAQLRTKANYEYYKEYRLKLKMSEKVSDEKQIMTDLVNTYAMIQRKLDKKDLTVKDFDHFFNYIKDNDVISEGIFFCMQEMISPYYYCMSKSFRLAWRSLDQDVRDEISEEDRLYTISAIVKSKTRVYEFMRKLFGEDIV